MEKKKSSIRISNIVILVSSVGIVGLLLLMNWLATNGGAKQMMEMIPLLVFLALLFIVPLIVILINRINPWRFRIFQRAAAPLFLLRLFRTLTLIVTIALIGLILMLYRYQKSVGNKGLPEYLPILMVLLLFLSIPIITWLVNRIHNQRIIYFGVILLLLTAIYGGIIFLENPDTGYYIGLTSAVILTVFFITYRFALFLFFVLVSFLFFCICWQGIPALLAITTIPKTTGLQFSFVSLICYSIVTVGAALISCAFIPREIEWVRYFFPYRNRFSPLDPTKKEDGFTLIELLISIAIIGILTTGLMHSWVNIIRAHKELQIRTHAGEIIHSEMSALMAFKELPEPSINPHELPIQLREFVTPYPFEGEYFVESSENGMVKIIVCLRQSLENNNTRHFRLIGYRRWETGKNL